MIHHISIAVQNPLRVANALAKILNGQAISFPPVPHAYIVMAYDDKGTAIEVYPLGTEIAPAGDNPEIIQKQAVPGFVPFHAAISVPVERARIEEIATEEGWRVQLGDRRFFQVIELWIENCLLLELLTADLVPEYLESTQPQNVEKLLAIPIHA